MSTIGPTAGDPRDARPSARAGGPSAGAGLKPNHVEQVSLLEGLAGPRPGAVDPAWAERLLRQDLARRERALGVPGGGPDPGDPGLVVALNDLGMLLSRRGGLEEAEALLRRAVAACRACFGVLHPRFATVLNNLALVLHQRGDLAEADPLYRRALRIRREQLAGDDPDLAVSLSGVAMLCQHRGDPDRAERLGREALAIRRKALGEHHPLTIQSLFELVMLRWHRRDWAGADAGMVEVLEAQRAAHGDRHPDVATGLALRAAILRRRGDLEGSERLLLRALAIRREALGEGHPLHVNGLKSLALLRRRMAARAAGDPAGQGPAGGGAAPVDSVEADISAFRHLLFGPGHPAAPPPAASTGPPPDPKAPPGRPDRGGGAARPTTEESMEPTSHDLSRELEALGDALTRLGERFLLAASQFHHPGAFPEPELLEEVADRRREFASVRERAERKAEALGVSWPPQGALDSVQGLSRLVDALALEEEKRAGIGAARRRAVEVLDGVLRLAYLGPAPPAALAEGQASARALAAALEAEGDGAELSPEARALAEGAHPLAGLLRLVERREELDVDEWAEAYDQVAASLGRSLAAAVAMSRVTLAPAPSAPAPGADADGRHDGRHDGPAGADRPGARTPAPGLAAGR